jgi:hypothetical protein
MNMNTNLSNYISETEQEEEITLIRYVPGGKREGRFIQWFRPILKWFGFLSTLAWGAAALSPTTFRIPVPLQGWVFIIAILWFFGYCAGLFNL